MKNYLGEALQTLGILNEDTFDSTADGIKELGNFMNNEDNDVLSIIDDEADDEDELKDSYIGKVILDCNVCHSLIYKDKDDVHIEEDDDSANRDEECPYCFSTDGYKIVGQVASYCDDCKDKDEEEDDDKDEEGEKEINESFERVDIETDREKMSMRTEEGGKVVVETEPIAKEDETDETIVPVTDEIADDIKDNEEEDAIVDEDEIEEISVDEFDELGESYLKKNYNNVVSYKTSNVIKENKNIKVEGVIKFASGKEKKTSFIFESFTRNNKGKVRIIGENKEIARGHRAFALYGKADGKKIIGESLAYKYTTKDNNGKATRICGNVKRNH